MKDRMCAGFTDKDYREFSRMSQYLKFYDLYQKNQELYEKYRKKMIGLEESKDVLEQFSCYDILSKVEKKNEEIRRLCLGYDFNKEVFEEVFGKYKQLSELWLTDMLKVSMEGKVFVGQREYRNHIYVGLEVLKKHFCRKFYYKKDLDGIFEKVSFDFIEDFLGHNLGCEEEGSEKDMKFV